MRVLLMIAALGLAGCQSQPMDPQTAAAFHTAGLVMLQPRPAPAPMIAMPRPPVTCTRMGNMVRCY